MDFFLKVLQASKVFWLSPKKCFSEDLSLKLRSLPPEDSSNGDSLKNINFTGNKS